MYFNSKVRWVYGTSLIAPLIIPASKAAYIAYNRRPIFRETESLLQRLCLVWEDVMFTALLSIFGDFNLPKSLWIFRNYLWARFKSYWLVTLVMYMQYIFLFSYLNTVFHVQHAVLIMYMHWLFEFKFQSLKIVIMNLILNSRHCA